MKRTQQKVKVKPKSEFKWQSHNVNSMINAINDDLDKLGIDKEKFRLSINGRKLSLGTCEVTGNIDHLGNITHTIIVLLMALADREEKRKEEFTELINELFKEFVQGVYQL